jgi:Cu/Ag efflux pump CusA
VIVELITFLAIPLSLLAAVAVLERMGQTLNTMTLGGFAVALGVLVDDAIIGIENTLRRLAENEKQGRPRLEVIRDATLEVRGPVVYATLVVITIFLPQLFSTTVQGKFVGPLALAFILAVVASLLVALTAAPALSALMLSARKVHGDQGWILWLKERQRRVIALSMSGSPGRRGADRRHGDRHPLPFLGGSFMPDFREGHFVMQVSPPPPALVGRDDGDGRTGQQGGSGFLGPPSSSRWGALLGEDTGVHTRANSISN